MKVPKRQPLIECSSQPVKPETIPCTPEEPCKACGGTKHPCYSCGEDLWCGAHIDDEAKALLHTPKGYELSGTAPGSGQAIYKPIKGSQVLGQQADPILQEFFDPESPDNVMQEVERILQIEQEFRQECEGLMLARKVRWATWPYQIGRAHV